jgi:hypothetical protein
MRFTASKTQPQWDYADSIHERYNVQGLNERQTQNQITLKDQRKYLSQADRSVHSFCFNLRQTRKLGENQDMLNRLHQSLRQYGVHE